MLLPIDVRKHSPRVRIIGIKLDGVLQAGAYLGVLLLVERSLVMIVAKDALIRCKRLWRAALRFCQVRFRDQTVVVAGDDRRDLLRNLFLNLSNTLDGMSSSR